MQQLTNEEIARVFSLYFGLPKSIRNIRWNSSIPSMESFIPNNNAIKDWCLLLTPLSAITDKHAVELVEIIKGEKILEKTKVIVEESIIKIYWSEILHESHKDYGYRYTATIYADLFTRTKNYGSSVKMDYEAYQHLIQQGYSVPIFISLNHPLNGKTPIELGIAIDKTVTK